MNFDDMKLSVEALSGGKNTVILDDMGMPSIMVRIPRSFLDEIDVDTAHSLHSAFIVDGVQKDFFHASKYQNTVINDRAYSLPFKDPKDYVTFDQALTYCKNKGPGWHLTTNAEWSLMALWSKKNGTMPRGNNNYGSDHSAAYEKGIRTYGSGDTIYRVATGSGPVSWAHDHTNAGVYDLNGNVREWVGGLRLVDGEIQVIPDNNAAVNTVDQSATSSAWRAILEDGSLVAPGTAGTLKYDASNADGSGNILIGTDSVNVSDGSTYANQTLETIAAKTGITVPAILKELALAPVDASHGGDRVYMRNVDERLPQRGGGWSYSSYAGVFCLSLYVDRTHSGSDLGFRAAFVE